MDWLKKLLAETSDITQLEHKITQKITQDYVAKNDYHIMLQAKKGLEVQIAQRDNDIKNLKANAKDNKDLQKQYDELQTKYNLDTQKLQKQYQQSRKENALDMAILKEKGRNTKAIKSLLYLGKITLKDNDTLGGLDLQAIKQSDPYLFNIEKASLSYMIDILF